MDGMNPFVSTFQEYLNNFLLLPKLPVQLGNGDSVQNSHLNNKEKRNRASARLTPQTYIWPDARPNANSCSPRFVESSTRSNPIQALCILTARQRWRARTHTHTTKRHMRAPTLALQSYSRRWEVVVVRAMQHYFPVTASRFDKYMFSILFVVSLALC